MPWTWGNAEAGFWGWIQIRNPPPGTGYALVTQGGTTFPYNYNLVTEVIAPSTSFFKITQTGGCSSNKVLCHFNLASQGVLPVGNASWNWSTQVFAVTADFGTGHTYTNFTNNSVNEIIVMTNSTVGTDPITPVRVFKTTYSTLTAAPIAVTLFTIAMHYNGISGPTKGFYFHNSINYTSMAILANDGPQIPSPAYAWPTGSEVNVLGNATLANLSIGQYLLNASAPIFNSKQWNLSTFVQTEGPAFNGGVPLPFTTTSYAGTQGMSTAVEALFFGKSALSPTDAPPESASEIMFWSTSSIRFSTAIPCQYPTFYLYGSNQFPGYIP
jgi:hypothetical protein